MSSKLLQYIHTCTESVPFGNPVKILFFSVFEFGVNCMIHFLTICVRSLWSSLNWHVQNQMLMHSQLHPVFKNISLELNRQFNCLDSSCLHSGELQCMTSVLNCLPLHACLRDSLGCQSVLPPRELPLTLNEVLYLKILHRIIKVGPASHRIHPCISKLQISLYVEYHCSGI